MPLTSVQLKAQVMIDTQAGSAIDDPTLTLLWTKNDGYTLWTQYLSTRVDVINILIAKNRGLVRFSGDGRSMDLQQEFDHLVTMRNQFIEELSAFSEFAAEPVVCEMTATSPILGNVGYINPNDGRFYGDITSIQLGYLQRYYNTMVCP